MPGVSCPGCGGRQSRRGLIACRGCWQRLPARLRDPVKAAKPGCRSTRRKAAVGEALAWLANNPGGVNRRRGGDG